MLQRAPRLSRADDSLKKIKIIADLTKTQRDMEDALGLLSHFVTSGLERPAKTRWLTQSRCNMKQTIDTCCHNVLGSAFAKAILQFVCIVCFGSSRWHVGGMRLARQHLWVY